MINRLNLEWHLFRIRLRLSLILLSQLFVTDSWVILATIELPLSYGLLWGLTRGHYAQLTCLYISLVALRFLWCVFVADETAEPDPPHSEPLERHPHLAALSKTIRADFGLAASHTAEFLLSPVAWRAFGCSAEQLRANKLKTVVAIGCLGIYSVFDLKCELAHAIARCHSNLIVPACERNRLRLSDFAGRTRGFRDRPQWQSWAISKIEVAYQINLTQWNLFADLQADQRVASHYGSFAVSSWIQRSQLANFSVRECVADRIAPLAEDGMLVPVSHSCCAFHSLFEGEWLESIRSQMLEQEKKPEMLSPTLVRLGALQHGLQTAGGIDPRSASTLVEKLPELEELVVKNEIPIRSGVTLKRPDTEQFAQAVLIPLMERELKRNADLVAPWSLVNLPELIAAADERPA